MKKLALLVACALLAVASGGCSLKLVRRPPPPSEWPTPGSARPDVEGQCTTSLAPPVLDTVAAVLLFSAAIYETRWNNTWAPYILAGAGLPVAVSAGYGYGVVTQCRRYRRLVDAP